MTWLKTRTPKQAPLRDVQDFQEDAEKRRGASFEEEASGVLKSDPATDVEGEVVDKLSGDKDEETPS